jgi:hypothetical protein
MPRVRGNYKERWLRKAQASTQDYTDGVRDPRADWERATTAARNSYVAGVQASIGRGAWEKGVTAAGSSKWQHKAEVLGSQRFGAGVADAQLDYQEGVAPYIAALEKLQLPGRGPKGDPRNLERVRVVCQTLRLVKTGERPASGGGALP